MPEFKARFGDLVRVNVDDALSGTKPSSATQQLVGSFEHDPIEDLRTSMICGTNFGVSSSTDDETATALHDLTN
jgi:HEAT repeat protein